MFKYCLALGLGSAATLLLTPVIRALAVRCKALDLPAERKVHQRAIPRLGGVAIFLGFTATMVLLLCPWTPLGRFLGVTINERCVGFVIAATIIVALGVRDDLHPLGARIKLLTQVLAALVAVWFGLRIEHFSLGPIDWELGLWSIPVTVLWIVGLTNAFNLVDGLDGLASGVAMITAFTLMAFALLHQQVKLALACAALAGCLLGFLRYNFHPASIFLGDSGSLFLGFTLAAISIRMAAVSTATASILIQLLAFGLPLAETILTVCRRALRSAHLVEAKDGQYHFGFTRDRTLFTADRDHIHHRLLHVGVTHRRAVVLLYAVCFLMGIAAFGLVAFRSWNNAAVLIAVAISAVYAIRHLRYDEFHALGSTALLSISRWRVFGWASFQVLADLGLTAAAFCGAWMIADAAPFAAAEKQRLLHAIPLVLFCKVAVFHLSGLYRIQWMHAGVPDVVRGMRSMILASAVVAAVLLVVFPDPPPLATMVLDFYLMCSLLLGIRFGVRVLQYSSNARRAGKRRVLIYGAGQNGVQVVRRLRLDPEYRLEPVGFIDDDPRKTNKVVHGYPIFGTVSDLPDVLRQSGIDELIITTRQIPPERLELVRNQCQAAGVGLRQFRLQLDRLPDADEVYDIRI